METLSEYTKYTIALAVAVLLYLPSQFLPADAAWLRWLVQGTVILAGASALFGLLLLTTVTTIIVKPGTVTKFVSLWGTLHMWSLMICFVSTAGLFLVFKVFGADSMARCDFALKDDAGREVTVTLPCRIAVADPQ